MSVFDSDIASDLFAGVPELVIRALAIPKEYQAIAIVSAEEMLRGQFNTIRQAEAGLCKVGLVQAYAYFEKRLQEISSLTVLAYTDAAHAEYLRLKALKLRVGTRDLRIASIAVAHDAKLISRNRRDFELVPGLKLELWN